MNADVLHSPYGAFPARFRSAKLVELCAKKNGVQTGPFGSQLHQQDYAKEGTPIITVEHLGDNYIRHQGLPRVTDADRIRLARYSLRNGDIVFSRVGSVDLRALVREAEEGWLFSGRCLRVRPNPALINPVYLSWFFGLPAFREHVRRIAVGATMPSLNTKLLSDVIICFPPLDEQEKLAGFLTLLDERSQINRKMNETLAATAATAFSRAVSVAQSLEESAASV